MSEQAVALLYNLEHTEKGRKIKFILIRMGIRMKNIQPEQYLTPLGILSGAKKIPPEGAQPPVYTGEGLSEEMLVMKGFSNALLDEFLLRMRKSGIPRVSLKAVLTPSNQDWDSLTLYEELKKEHAAMTASTPQAFPPAEASPLHSEASGTAPDTLS